MIWAIFKWTCIVIGVGWMLSLASGILLVALYGLNLMLGEQGGAR